MHLAGCREDALDACRRSRCGEVLLHHLCQRRPLLLLFLSVDLRERLSDSYVFVARMAGGAAHPRARARVRRAAARPPRAPPPSPAYAIDDSASSSPSSSSASSDLSNVFFSDLAFDFVGVAFGFAFGAIPERDTH